MMSSVVSSKETKKIERIVTGCMHKIQAPERHGRLCCALRCNGSCMRNAHVPLLEQGLELLDSRPNANEKKS